MLSERRCPGSRSMAAAPGARPSAGRAGAGSHELPRARLLLSQPGHCQPEQPTHFLWLICPLLPAIHFSFLLHVRLRSPPSCATLLV